MGYNLVWECTRCNEYACSMRGEEGDDFQFIVRQHRECFKVNAIKVYCDADTLLGSTESERHTRPMWEYEERPKIVGFK
jgi:hypothetical protein